MLLVWTGPETSHHLDDERQNFCALSRNLLNGAQQFWYHTDHLILLRMMVQKQMATGILYDVACARSSTWLNLKIKILCFFQIFLNIL